MITHAIQLQYAQREMGVVSAKMSNIVAHCHNEKLNSALTNSPIIPYHLFVGHVAFGDWT